MNFERSYETVAAAQTDQLLGTNGAAGDFIEGLVCVVATPATSSVGISDSAAGPLISVLPDAVGSGVGTYIIPLGLTSKAGAWAVTTGAGVSVIAIGKFGA